MILQRITQNLRAQNWAAVMLELAIVSVGVMIGIQAANWNTERQLAKEELALLVQMHEAFVDDVNSVIDSKKPKLEAIEAIRYILRAIRDGVEPENREDLLDALLKSRSAPGYVFEAPIATILFSSGGLTQLTSPDLRRAIVNYRNLVYVMQQSASSQIAMLSDIENGAESGVYLNPDLTSRDDMLYDYDFEEVAAKREFYQRLLITTLANEKMSDDLITLTETIIKEIEAAQR